MTAEISCDEASLNLEKPSKENWSSNTNPPDENSVTVNGISNGYIEKHSKKEHSSDKDKHRDRDKDKDRHKDRPRDKDKEREKHREKDKHNSSSSSKDKERDKDKKHSSSSSSSKDKDRDKERKHKDERKDKDREHKSSSSKDKDKEHKSSSSSKDKEKDKHSSGSKDKEKSSSHRDKSSSSSKDKHSSSSSKDKEKIKSSSSSGDKDKKPSGDKEKHKSKDKDREARDKDREHKEKAKIKEEERLKEKFEQREEPVVMKQEMPEWAEEEDVDAAPEPVIERLTIKQETVGVKVEPEDDSDEDVPLARRALPVKREIVDEDSEDDIPLMARKKIKKEKPSKKRKAMSDDEDEDFKNDRKKKPKKEMKKMGKQENSTQESPKKKKKEEAEVWKWWEEEKKDDGTKWKFLEHKGPIFAPPYERIPSSVRFYFNGKEMRLSEGAEEVATFYARMLDHDYTTKEAFNKNFFKDWRKQMTSEEQGIITDLTKCNFKEMHSYFVQRNEERKAMSKEEKKKIKETNDALIEEYGFCKIDGHKEKIGNFKIEPPGLFRGRGEHPKMGMLKKRVMPEDVIINCSKDSKIPVPPEGRKWKEVRHDNSVTWLASWTENVQGQVKYIMLNPSSKLKGEKDWAKYELARKLHKCINKIRKEYREHWKSKEMRIRQRSVALYFIDKLALRAGNEKDEDQADTVGCCSLRVEHISLHEEKDGKEWVVVFDFLGKDSIRYYNEVSVEKRVFKNLQLFMQNKQTGDDLFDRLNTMIMNKHLSELMEGLTAKVFRTYNASITLQEQLNQLTKDDMSVPEKILAYNRANRAVAILCNHQRSIPKTFAKSMENMQVKLDAKQDQIREAERQYKQAKRDSKSDRSTKSRIEMEKKKKTLDRLREQLDKMNLQVTDKEENKDIALGTSKLNYLDPRISVAWCKKHEVPIEKVYNKTQRSKFNWAIDMATEDYIF